MLPQNLAERFSTIIILVLAFVVTASFLGSLTTAMTRLQIIASQRSAQFAALSRYLSDCGISRVLSVRVQRNARHAFRERKRNTPESSVELIALISEPLRAEIHYEVHSPNLTKHPFFYLFNKVNLTGMRHVCHSAVSAISLSRGDVLFSEFEVPVAPKTFFITEGKLLYTRNLGEQQKIGSRQWIAEPALWTMWAHRGTLVGRTECQLIAIDAQRFVNITVSFPTLHASNYAVKFVKWLNGKNASDLLTDIGEDNECTRRLVYESFQEVDKDVQVGNEWVRKGRNSIISQQTQHTNISCPSTVETDRMSTLSSVDSVSLFGYRSRTLANLWHKPCI